MPLHYDLTAIANHRTVCFTTAADGDLRMNPVTDALITSIYAAAGVGQITAKNLDTVCKRYHIYQRLHGALLTVWAEDGDGTYERTIDANDIAAHVGLHTNWTFTDESDAKWRKRTMDNAMREARLEVARCREDKAPATVTA